MMMQDVPPMTAGSVGTSATLIQGGNTVVSGNHEMSQTRTALQQQRIEMMANKQLAHLGPH